MFSFREIVLLFIIVVSNILTYNLTRWYYEASVDEVKSVKFENNITSSKKHLEDDIKEIRGEKEPDINDSIGKHSIVL